MPNMYKPSPASPGCTHQLSVAMTTAVPRKVCINVFLTRKRPASYLAGDDSVGPLIPSATERFPNSRPRSSCSRRAAAAAATGRAGRRLAVLARAFTWLLRKRGEMRGAHGPFRNDNPALLPPGGLKIRRISCGWNGRRMCGKNGR